MVNIYQQNGATAAGEGATGDKVGGGDRENSDAPFETCVSRAIETGGRQNCRNLSVTANIAYYDGANGYSCRIYMTSLQGATFYVRAAGDIRVRPKASNKNGCGIPCSQVTRTIKLTGTKALRRPKIKSRVGEQINLTWEYGGST